MVTNGESIVIPVLGGLGKEGAVDTYTLITDTLLAASWVTTKEVTTTAEDGTSSTSTVDLDEPYYDYETKYPSASFDVQQLQPYGTIDQVRAFYQATCKGSPTENKLYCLGTVPTIDIPVMFYLRQKGES